MPTGASLVGEDDHDAVAAAQRRRGQAQLPALRHPQVPQPQDPGFQESQGQGRIQTEFDLVLREKTIMSSCLNSVELI